MSCVCVLAGESENRLSVPPLARCSGYGRIYLKRCYQPGDVGDWCGCVTPWVYVNRFAGSRRIACLEYRHQLPPLSEWYCDERMSKCVLCCF